MKNVIPFTKDVVFDNNIAEIVSISLEHNYDITSNSVSGEFIVSGEYKSHELSVNKEEFKHILPFSIDLDDDIDMDTVSFNIQDFTYDFHDNTLCIKIDYCISGDRKIVEEVPVFEEFENRALIDELEEINNIEEINNEEDIEVKEEENGEYVTYCVHVIEEDETIESISLKYGVSVNILEEYNDIKNIQSKDKIIIPIYKDE